MLDCGPIFIPRSAGASRRWRLRARPRGLSQCNGYRRAWQSFDRLRTASGVGGDAPLPLVPSPAPGLPRRQDSRWCWLGSVRRLSMTSRSCHPEARRVWRSGASPPDASFVSMTVPSAGVIPAIPPLSGGHPPPAEALDEQEPSRFAATLPRPGENLLSAVTHHLMGQGSACAQPPRSQACATKSSRRLVSLAGRGIKICRRSCGSVVREI